MSALLNQNDLSLSPLPGASELEVAHRHAGMIWEDKVKQGPFSSEGRQSNVMMMDRPELPSGSQPVLTLLGSTSSSSSPVLPLSDGLGKLRPTIRPCTWMQGWSPPRQPLPRPGQRLCAWLLRRATWGRSGSLHTAPSAPWPSPAPHTVASADFCNDSCIS